MTAPVPGTPWSGRSHGDLAELVRELLLAGHLIDRAGMPHVIGHLGREPMAEVAIGEWMAASPIYTKRMQALLGFCLLYTSDAADDLLCVDLGGRRIIKQKTKHTNNRNH